MTCLCVISFLRTEAHKPRKHYITLNLCLRHARTLRMCDAIKQPSRGVGRNLHRGEGATRFWYEKGAGPWTSVVGCHFWALYAMAETNFGWRGGDTCPVPGLPPTAVKVNNCLLLYSSGRQIQNKVLEKMQDVFHDNEANHDSMLKYVSLVSLY